MNTHSKNSKSISPFAPLTAFRKHWKIMALSVVLAAGLALLISALQPQEYRSEVGALIVQKQNFETDTYLAAKSAEKVGKNMAQVLGTSSFFYRVVAEGSVDLSAIEALSAEDRREEWAKKVSASVVPDTGLLEIHAYDENPETAEKLAMAVANVMTSSASEYHGGGDSIVITVVDLPVTSRYPVRPNILANVAVAMAVALVISATYVFLRSDVPFAAKAIVGRVKQSKSKMAVTAPVDAIQDVPAIPAVVPVSVPEPVIELVEQTPVAESAVSVPEVTAAEPEQPRYTVLDPLTLPQVDGAPFHSKSEKPVTMFDHLKS